MSLHTKQVGLRQSLGTLLIKRPSLLIRSRVNRLKGRNLFRAIVRLVLEYIDWLREVPVVEEIHDEISVNVQATQRSRIERKSLSLEDRSILLTDPILRSARNKVHVAELLRKLRAFRKYSEQMRQSLARVCIYRYFPAGRTIVRQGHEANNLYFLASGELALTRTSVDRLTGEETVIDMGLLQPGDTFGEIAMLHVIPRTATAVSKSPVDLLLIDRDAFDEFLRDTLTNEWDVLRDALVHFNYFKTWSENTIRECCIISRLKEFQANEVLLGDGKGMVNYVHFLLEGECRLIEDITIRERRTRRGFIQYELYEPPLTTQEVDTKKRESMLEKTQSKYETNDTHLSVAYDNVKDDSEQNSKRATEGTIDSIDYAHGMLSSIPRHGGDSNKPQIDADRISVITTTLFDVVNEWHEITDVAAMLMREPSASAVHPPSDIQTVFMQVCRFYRGSCFGLGEQMRNRRIVTTTPVRCLLVPRYWLFERNRSNIWERVKLFMDSKFPTKRQSFKRLVKNRRWIEYKSGLSSSIIEHGRAPRRTAKIHDVPYSVRINEASAQT